MKQSLLNKTSSQSIQNQPSKVIDLLDERRWPTTGSIIFLILIAICLIVPFANKAFHIDDPLFLWVAKHIPSHPFDPYRFKLTWCFDEMEMWQVTKNPPLASYYIASIAYFVGWGERALHLAFLIPAIAVVIGTYFLARKLCFGPVLASLLGLITPVFILSSTTIMCDTMMLAFWVWAILLWIRGTETKSHLALALSGFLIALCALTKYYGMSLIVLLPVYSVARERRISYGLIYLIIPVFILILYQWKTHALYGRGLLLDAGTYASEFRENVNFGLITKGFVGLVFIGGCLASVLFYLPFLWSRNILSIQLTVCIVVILALSVTEGIGVFPLRDAYGVKWAQIVQLGIMVIIGINLFALTIADLWNHRGDASSLLLFCWVMGTFAFASFINWSVNGRSILPMAPAVGILLMRRIEQRAFSYKKRSTLFWPLTPAICLVLLVAWADYGLANTARNAVEKICAAYDQKREKLWFQGHWGFQYYMEMKGTKIAQMRRFHPVPGDILVVPENNYYTFPVPLDKMVRPLETIELPLVCGWLTTMNRFQGAGFYSDIWGILPFVIGANLPERYNILQIESPPDPPDAASVAGNDKEEYHRAIAKFTQAPSKNVSNPGAFFDRGNVFVKNGEYDKGISDYTQALTIDPYDAKNYVNRGSAYFLKGEYARAVGDYTQALRMKSGDARTYLKRGLAYSKSGAYDMAWEDVKRAESLGLQAHPAFLEELRKVSGKQH